MKPYQRFFGTAAKITKQQLTRNTQKKEASTPKLPPGATGWDYCCLTGFMIPDYKPKPVEKAEKDQSASNTITPTGP